MNTSTTPAWLTANQADGPSVLAITLIDNTEIELSMRGVEVQVLLRGIFVANYFRADNGTYYAASQIKSAVAR